MRSNLSYFSVQNEPFHRVKWVRLRGKMAETAMQDERNRFARRLKRSRRKVKMAAKGQSYLLLVSSFFGREVLRTEI